MNLQTLLRKQQLEDGWARRRSAGKPAKKAAPSREVLCDRDLRGHSPHPALTIKTGTL